MTIGLLRVVDDMDAVDHIQEAVGIPELLVDMAGDAVSFVGEDNGEETEQKEQFHDSGTGRSHLVCLATGVTCRGAQS